MLAAVGSRAALALLLLLSLLVGESGSDEVYHNQFAVHVPGGSSDPGLVDSLAERHGLVSRGQIGALEDHFLLEHGRISKRSPEPSHHHARKLVRNILG